MRGTTFYIPVDIATMPANGEALCARWWTVHPEKGVAFYAQLVGYLRSEEPSPQCNPSEYTARALTARLHPECEVRQIPVVFMAHAIREFNRLRKAALAA